MTEKLDEVRAGIAAIDLGEPRAISALGDAELPALPDYKPDVAQVVTIGSQIAEFAAAVPADLRATIANCILLAQLAADRSAETPAGDSLGWFEVYLDTLKKCGWIIERNEIANRWAKGDGAHIHQEILKALTAVVAPGGGAASALLGVLSDLQQMESDPPFFKIFDRASRHQDSQLFQISCVSVDAGGVPRLTLAAYQVRAEVAATQILFFRFAGTEAKFRSMTADVWVEGEILRQLAGTILAKVGGQLAGNIVDIDI